MTRRKKTAEEKKLSREFRKAFEIPEKDRLKLSDLSDAIKNFKRATYSDSSSPGDTTEGG